MKKFVGFLFLVLGFLILGQTAEAFLTRDLTLGSRGEDVRQLQKFLNRSGSPVASVGPGSPGQETAFFGQLTKQAVRRYQELHQAEILAPIGLATGTGYVGRLTRRQINLAADFADHQPVTDTITPSPDSSEPEILVTEPLVSRAKTNEPTPKSVSAETSVLNNNLTPDFSLPSPPPRSATMSLFLVNPSTGRPGTMVTIAGEGFDTKANTVYTGSEVLSAIPSADGQSLTVTINSPFTGEADPEGFDLPLRLYVENDTGISNPLIFNLVFD
ncbi:MAG: peptidoglycan-binding protein [Candidatus Paceibacterota bacterium]